MQKKTIAWGIVLLGLALASGSATPQVLIAQGFAGERAVRYTIRKSGQSTKESGDLFNLCVRLCDHNNDGSDGRLAGDGGGLAYLVRGNIGYKERLFPTLDFDEIKGKNSQKGDRVRES